MNALDRFHASWPRGVAPSIVEHFAGAADHVAPAMTLWSGAERLAGVFASRGLFMGDTVGCALTPGIRWVQTLIACDMRRQIFAPLVPGAAAGKTRAHLSLTGELEVPTPSDGPPSEVEHLVQFAEGATWSTVALDSAIERSFEEGALPRAGSRMVMRLPWSQPAGFFGLWLGLVMGAEVHVGVLEEELHLLGPEVIVTEPGGVEPLLSWVPRTVTGTAVVIGSPEELDMRTVTSRGWRIVPVSLPSSGARG